MYIFGQHEENTIRQLQDVASRADRAALMADGHVGYIMPIGGVAAYREKVSVVGVGFDIACIAAGTPVTQANGSTLPIENVAAEDGALCWDGATVRPVMPHFGAVARGVRETVHVELANGRLVRATPDHEILTTSGWKRADALTTADCIACSPFIGLPYEPSNGQIKVEVKHQRAADELGRRGLLPLRANDPRLPALLRVLGYACGDGHLSRDGKRVSLYVFNDRDAVDLRGDIERIGFPPREYRRTKAPHLREEINVSVGSVAFHALLAGLGAPVGRKTWPERPMEWLFEQSAWLRATFLSAFASAEMMTPRTHASGTVPNLQLKQSGEQPHAIEFVARLLQSLGFSVSVAPSGPTRNGRTSWVAQILGGQAEQLRFIQEVGFNRSIEKRRASASVASIAWAGAAFVRNRDAAKAEAHSLRASGAPWKEAISAVAERYGVSESFAYHAFYDRRGRSRRVSRVATTADATGEVSWVPVQSVVPADAVPVYDIVTADPAQSFVAAGIVVHNCGNCAIRTDLRVEDVTRGLALDDIGRNPHRLASDRLINQAADEVASAISFGIGRKNQSDDAPVDHELFQDAAWYAIPNQGGYRDTLRDKARRQLGTVGSGNHYVDLFADETGAVWVGVHFGSRGLGHTIASDFLSLSQGGGWGERAREKEVLLDLAQPVGHDYWQLMELAGRYAYAGREWVARKVVQLLGGAELEMVHNHHNFAWRETHLSADGELVEYVVVRKGATPAWPGQQGFIGGSMGDDAVIVEGTAAPDGSELASMQREALYSTVHGAGRVMSRTEAAGKRTRKGQVIKPGKISPAMVEEWLAKKGVVLRGGGLDEAPQVYRRLEKVLKAQGDTITVRHVLRPLVVVMAGANEIDPYKD